jgi:hypothetical protein
VYKYVCHSKTVLKIALEHGWYAGAQYTNLRNIRTQEETGFIDIDWKNYSFKKHIHAVKEVRPLFTVARDVVDITHLPSILDEAQELSLYAKNIIIVPKDIRLASMMEEVIPSSYILGYSVPSKYGGTIIQPQHFKRSVHLLGGRPDTQRQLAKVMNVISIDCNRFTLDAAYGDYFDGTGFKKHPIGGYKNCIRDSIRNINHIWLNYKPKT